MDHFLDLDHPQTLIECYRGLTFLYTDDFELPVEKISQDLCSEEVRSAALELLAKAPALPSSPPLLRGLLAAAVNNADAVRLAIRAAQADPAVSSLLMRNTKWMLYALPTFTWTVRLCLALCDAPRAAARFDGARETDGLIAKVVESCEPGALADLPKLLLRIDYQRLARLDRSGFFALLRGRIEAAEDPLPYLAVLTTLARLGEAPAFAGFARVLRARLAEGGPCRHAVLRALCVLSAYPACVRRFRDARLLDAVADLDFDRREERYVSTFMENMHDID